MRNLLLALALLTAACGGDSSGPSRIEVEGTWSGQFSTSGGTPVTLTMTLIETNGSVTGNSTLVTTGGSIAETVTGTYSPPQVSLQFHSAGFEDSNLSGTVGETTLTGTLNGSGFNNISITLSRQ
jgi:hypothetical protein